MERVSRNLGGIFAGSLATEGSIYRTRGVSHLRLNELSLFPLAFYKRNAKKEYRLMNLSELIVRLEQARQEHGDIPVTSFGDWREIISFTEVCECACLRPDLSRVETKNFYIGC